MASSASRNTEINAVMEDIIIPDHLYCPICTQIMKNPVQLNGNKQYTFCGFCIAQWLQLKKSNPLTNQPLNETVLIPDNTLNSEIKQIYSLAKEKCDWLIIQSNEDKNECNRLEAIAAQKWFDEKLFHLQSSYEWTPWIKQTALDAIQVLINKLYNCNSSKPSKSSAILTPQKLRVKSKSRSDHEFIETSEMKQGEQDHEDLEKEELTEKEILECIEYIESHPFEDDEEENEPIPGSPLSLTDEKSIKLVEQIRAEGKKLIDDKCNETIQKIHTLSYDGINVKTEQMVQECQHSVTIVSTIIGGISKAIKGLTGWISQFFLFYIKKILNFLAIAGNPARI